MKDCCSMDRDKKVLDYVVIGVVVLLLIGSLAVGISFSFSKKVFASKDLDLSQYRSENIPKDCRLPIYESRIESWKEYLSHHEDTNYCLDYFN